jgi:hypothetical protein
MISEFLSPGSHSKYLADGGRNDTNLSFSVSSQETVGLIPGVCNGPSILKVYIPLCFHVDVMFLHVLLINRNGMIVIL